MTKDYTCESCGGSGKVTTHGLALMCSDCHGTGEKQITIPLRLYKQLTDRIKLAEKQRDLTVKLLGGEMCDAVKYLELGCGENDICSECYDRVKQAILSYGEVEK